MKQRRRDVIGTVYLLHFSRPLAHARHYIGWSERFEERLDHHTDGCGARIVRAAAERGISAELARFWEGKTRQFERKLKTWKCAPKLCPICREIAREARQQAAAAA